MVGLKGVAWWVSRALEYPHQGGTARGFDCFYLEKGHKRWSGFTPDRGH